MSTSTAAVLIAEQLNTLRRKTLDGTPRALLIDYSSSKYGILSVLQVSGRVRNSDGFGRIHSANVENASYGGTICAERTAIVKAVTEGHRSFIAIGVATDVFPATAPCGICRQVIREFSSTVPIYMFTPDGYYEMMTLDELMPKSFGPENLPPAEELSK